MLPELSTIADAVRALALHTQRPIRQVVLIGEDGSTVWAFLVGPRSAEPDERGPGISQVRIDILKILEEAGKPLTTTRVLEAMARHKPPMEWSQRSVSDHLARMVEDQTIANPEGARPPGYRLPA